MCPVTPHENYALFVTPPIPDTTRTEILLSRSRCSGKNQCYTHAQLQTSAQQHSSHQSRCLNWTLHHLTLAARVFAASLERNHSHGLDKSQYLLFHLWHISRALRLAGVHFVIPCTESGLILAHYLATAADLRCAFNRQTAHKKSSILTAGPGHHKHYFLLPSFTSCVRNARRMSDLSQRQRQVSRSLILWFSMRFGVT